MQFDPHLKRRLLRADDSGAGKLGSETVAVLARLRDARQPVPGLHTRTVAGNIVTGTVLVRDIVALRGHPNVASLKQARTLFPELERSLPAIRISPARTHGMTGRGTVVGVIDSAFDVTHQNFRNEGGSSRFKCIWVQDDSQSASSPAPFGYGRLLTKSLIDAALRSSSPLRALSYEGFTGRPEGSHGTHVADIAAGNGRAPGAAKGVAFEADLIAVDLFGGNRNRRHSLADSGRLLEAARFIFDQAGDRPCVINISQGSNGGPHDHTPLLVQGLDALLRERPNRAIVMSCGNYFSKGWHKTFDLRSSGRADLEIVVGRTTRTVEIEVWYPGADRYVATLLDPNGVTVLELSAGEDKVSTGRNGREVASGFHRQQDPNALDNQIDIFIEAPAAPGKWKLRLNAEVNSIGFGNAYIEREDRNDVRFRDAESFQTTNSISNGLRTISVANVDHSLSPITPATSSSAGPTRDARGKPDLAAPGVSIRAARSAYIPRNGPSVSQGTIRMTGTSMAAPHVTGTIALMFEASARPLWSTEVATILRRTAYLPAGGDPRRIGAGVLNAGGAIAAVRARNQIQTRPEEESMKTAEQATTLDQLLPLPPINTLNVGITRARTRDFEAHFGRVDRSLLGVNCGRENYRAAPKKVRQLLIPHDLPFARTQRVHGIRPFIALLTSMFNDVEANFPGTLAELYTGGLFCPRYVRGSTTNPSTHTFGCAIDLGFGGAVDRPKDDLVQRGLLERVAPAASAHGLYWGAAFSREDSMHFEASLDLLQFWKQQGLI